MADRGPIGDAEALTVAVLKAALPGVRVATRAPKDNVAEYVRLYRAGGPGTQLVDAPMVIIECWAMDEVAAERLSARARSAMLAVEGRRIGNAAISNMHETGGPAYFDDPENVNYHRYQFVVQFTVRWYPS